MFVNCAFGSESDVHRSTVAEVEHGRPTLTPWLCKDRNCSGTPLAHEASVISCQGVSRAVMSDQCCSGQ